MLVIKQFGPVTYAMGTLQEILAGTGISTGVRALPNDVAGCTLKMSASGWVGCLGALTNAQAALLPLTNVAIAGATVIVDGLTRDIKMSKIVLSNFPDEKTYFDFSSTPDGACPSSDAMGKSISLYCSPTSMIPTIASGGLIKENASDGIAVYLDTLKHSSNITEAGCKFQLRDSGDLGSFALCLWSDYTSVLFSQGLTTSCHLTVSSVRISYDMWDAGVYYPNLAVASVNLPLNVDTTLAVRFGGNTAEIYLNNSLVLRINDSRIRTIDRKVACFEIYSTNTSILGPKIISGYSISNQRGSIPYGFVHDNNGGVFKEAAITGDITITGTYQNVIPNITRLMGIKICLINIPIIQTSDGLIYIDAAVTHTDGSIAHHVKVISMASSPLAVKTAILVATLTTTDLLNINIVGDANAVGVIKYNNNCLPNILIMDL